MKSTEEKIKVMQAYVDGEEVECANNSSTQWRNTPQPHWSWDIANYRIKPATKEMTVSEIEEVLGYTIKVVK